MRLTTIIIAIVILTSCEDVVNRPFKSGDRKLVVEGVISNENTRHLISLRWSASTPNGLATRVDGAIVTISDGTTTYALLRDGAAGDYYTPPMRAVVGQTYTLRILYDGKEYVAQDSPVPAEPMNPLSYRKVNNGYAINFEESGEDANYVRHDIAWYSPDCPSSSCFGQVMYYDLKTIDVNEGTKPPKEDFVFPAGSAVTRRKYSLSPAYKTYLRAVLSETEWRGSAFDVEHANAPTNLTNGATGFFATCSVVVDFQDVK